MIYIVFLIFNAVDKSRDVLIRSVRLRVRLYETLHQGISQLI